MSILDSIFGSQQSRGHWAWAGIQQQLHTRSLPQVGCPVCEAEGWIPASKPAPAMAACQQSPDAESTPDDTPAYLALTLEHLDATIRNLSAACRDSRVDESLGEFTLDALRGIRAEIAAEVEARRAEA